MMPMPGVAGPIDGMNKPNMATVSEMPSIVAAPSLPNPITTTAPPPAEAPPPKIRKDFFETLAWQDVEILSSSYDF